MSHNRQQAISQSGKTLSNYVAGKFVESNNTFANISPVDGGEINRVAEAGAELVDEAVVAARQSLSGDWGLLTQIRRSELMHKVADGIEARFEEFVAAEIVDTGKSLWQARNIDIPRGAANFRFFADLANSRVTDSFQTDSVEGPVVSNYAVYKPLGVVAIIAPWNLPLLLLTWKIAPAMAVGNAVIAKPSEETPSTATLLAEVMHDAGVPSGAFNLLHGFGPKSVGELLSQHPGIDGLTFTGESTTGSTIMRAAAANVKALSFELGGKNPAIIFEDANFDAAVEGTAKSVFTNGGQVCLCTERVYVQRGIFEKFVERLKLKAEALKIGWPEDEDTDMGPLISRQHQQKVLAYYRLAVEEGANVICGGGVPAFGDVRDKGAYVEPTILTGLPETARCVQEEVFGPI